jgi:hypothetical protein
MFALRLLCTPWLALRKESFLKIGEKKENANGIVQLVKNSKNAVKLATGLVAL